METYQAAVWSQHGLFASGPDFDTTFGLAHTIEKSAEIYVKVLSTGRPILQTIEDDSLRAIAADFGVKLNEAFLGLAGQPSRQRRVARSAQASSKTPAARRGSLVSSRFLYFGTVERCVLEWIFPLFWRRKILYFGM